MFLQINHDNIRVNFNCLSHQNGYWKQFCNRVNYMTLFYHFILTAEHIMIINLLNCMIIGIISQQI